MSKEKVTELLIDCDIIAYEAAHKSDGKFYRYPEVDFCCFESKEMASFVKKNKLDPTLVETDYKPLPPERAYGYVDERIGGVFSFFEREIPYRGFLTGRDNFRYKIATIQRYKGNRVQLRKPENLQAIRDYLVERYNTTVTEGEEADDALGYNQTATSCICTTDKDLNNIPGFHFNWGRDEFFQTNELDCLRSFYGQLITGDPGDNILGIFGLGNKSAAFQAVQALETEAEMFELVRSLYRQRFGNYAEPFLLETGRLLWIRRKPGQMWSFPEV